ncbi:MFS transporter, partial [Serratia fonticola]|nr:MFS transporter [Serratia fonticola]
MSSTTPAQDFRPPGLGWAPFGLGLGVFMYVVDGRLANVSLPTIAGNLGASSS